ncbi:RraA family protein [Halomonas dongshanensis]|uniref:Putative 4-hydroxy-4-methyl-2-oxoglutarate aldolase n=1 Tax=Halomonas dongshanensis TaxID=2890835 RepID=A0ABT2E8W7_9GAMM|nr:RraA family protein [Halomonas dongshanensis]MCS2608001.1 RraA family protein [Halomonas dongshanensis]
MMKNKPYPDVPEKQLRLMSALAGLQPSSLGHHLEDSLPADIKLMTPASLCLGTAVTVYQPTNDSTPVHMAIELLTPGDVLVIDRAASQRVACVGEMVATAAKLKGAKGIVVNGLITDLEQVSTLAIPVFARGCSVITTRALYSPGAQLGESVTIGGIEIKTGDIIFGDANGLLSIDPLDPRIWEVIELSVKDEIFEKEAMFELQHGTSLASLNGVDRERFFRDVHKSPVF